MSMSSGCSLRPYTDDKVGDYKWILNMSCVRLYSNTSYDITNKGKKKVNINNTNNKH